MIASDRPYWPPTEFSEPPHDPGLHMDLLPQMELVSEFTMAAEDAIPTAGYSAIAFQFFGDGWGEGGGEVVFQIQVATNKEESCFLDTPILPIHIVEDFGDYTKIVVENIDGLAAFIRVNVNVVLGNNSSVTARCVVNFLGPVGHPESVSFSLSSTHDEAGPHYSRSEEPTSFSQVPAGFHTNGPQITAYEPNPKAPIRDVSDSDDNGGNAEGENQPNDAEIPAEEYNRNPGYRTKATPRPIKRASSAASEEPTEEPESDCQCYIFCGSDRLELEKHIARARTANPPEHLWKRRAADASRDCNSMNDGSYRKPGASERKRYGDVYIWTDYPPIIIGIVLVGNTTKVFVKLELEGFKSDDVVYAHLQTTEKKRNGDDNGLESRSRQILDKNGKATINTTCGSILWLVLFPRNVYGSKHNAYKVIAEIGKKKCERHLSALPYPLNEGVPPTPTPCMCTEEDYPITWALPIDDSAMDSYADNWNVRDYFNFREGLLVRDIMLNLTRSSGTSEELIRVEIPENPYASTRRENSTFETIDGKELFSTECPGQPIVTIAPTQAFLNSLVPLALTGEISPGQDLLKGMSIKIYVDEFLCHDHPIQMRFGCDPIKLENEVSTKHAKAIGEATLKTSSSALGRQKVWAGLSGGVEHDIPDPSGDGRRAYHYYAVTNTNELSIPKIGFKLEISGDLEIELEKEFVEPDCCCVYVKGLQIEVHVDFMFELDFKTPQNINELEGSNPDKAYDQKLEYIEAYILSLGVSVPITRILSRANIRSTITEFLDSETSPVRDMPLCDTLEEPACDQLLNDKQAAVNDFDWSGEMFVGLINEIRESIAVIEEAIPACGAIYNQLHDDPSRAIDTIVNLSSVAGLNPLQNLNFPSSQLSHQTTGHRHPGMATIELLGRIAPQLLFIRGAPAYYNAQLASLNWLEGFMGSDRQIEEFEQWVEDKFPNGDAPSEFRSWKTKSARLALKAQVHWLKLALDIRMIAVEILGRYLVGGLVVNGHHATVGDAIEQIFENHYGKNAQIDSEFLVNRKDDLRESLADLDHDCSSEYSSPYTAELKDRTYFGSDDPCNIGRNGLSVASESCCRSVGRAISDLSYLLGLYIPDHEKELRESKELAQKEGFDPVSFLEVFGWRYLVEEFAYTVQGSSVIPNDPLEGSSNGEALLLVDEDYRHVPLPLGIKVSPPGFKQNPSRSYFGSPQFLFPANNPSMTKVVCDIEADFDLRAKDQSVFNFDERYKFLLKAKAYRNIREAAAHALGDLSVLESQYIEEVPKRRWKNIFNKLPGVGPVFGIPE